MVKTKEKPQTPRSRAVRHVVRSADNRLVELKLTRKLAMAAYCTECMGFEDSPQNCTSKKCPMYPYRAKTRRTAKGTMDSL